MTGHRRSDRAILDELVGLCSSNPESQLRSLLGAHQYRRLYRLVHRYLPARAAVLDWGVGLGHFSYFLCRSGYAASGYSFHDFELRPRLDGYRFVMGTDADPVTIPFDDATFDGVCSVGVLEHVRETGGDELASLREIRRVLRPGGVFICYHFPNRFSLVEGISRFVPNKHVHPYKFTERQIRRLAADSGLQLLEVRRYGFLPRNWGGRLRPAMRHSRVVASAWDAADAVLSVALSPLCQNYLFVARRLA